jgi:hypothetical protein
MLGFIAFLAVFVLVVVIDWRWSLADARDAKRDAEDYGVQEQFRL